MRFLGIGKSTIDVILPVKELGLTDLFKEIAADPEVAFSLKHDKAPVSSEKYEELVAKVKEALGKNGGGEAEFNKHVFPGGSAANPFSIMANFLKEKFSLLSLMGIGPRGKVAREKLGGLGIEFGPNLDAEAQDRVKMPVSVIFVDEEGLLGKSGGKYIIKDPGQGREQLTPAHVKSYIEEVKPDFTYLLASFIKDYSYEAFDAAVETLEEQGSVIAFAPPTNKDIPPAIIERSRSIIINSATYTAINMDELPRITGRQVDKFRSIEIAQGWLKERRSKLKPGEHEPTILASDGTDGVYIIKHNNWQKVPIHNKDTEVVNLLGAGDATVGGFFLGKSIGLRDTDAVKLGQAISDYIIRQHPAQLEDRKDAVKFVKQILKEMGHRDKLPMFSAKVEAIEKYIVNYPVDRSEDKGAGVAA